VPLVDFAISSNQIPVGLPLRQCSSSSSFRRILRIQFANAAPS
jgi:hypothetical protein